MYIALFIFLALIIFYLKFSSRIPILMYHRIASVPGDRNALPPQKFTEQLKYLNQNGYHTITIEQLESHYLKGTPLPSKPVVLTFDDGYADNFTCALPMLQKYNMVGNVFAIAHWIGKNNTWEDFGKALTTTMDMEQLKAWQAQGNYIGAHTCEHPFLSQCDQATLQQELTESKAFLEQELGKSITCICYPYGDFDQKVLTEVDKAGFHLGLAIFNEVPLWSLNLLALPRIPIPSGQRMWEFKLKVSKFHTIFIILRQLERKFKKFKRLFR